MKIMVRNEICGMGHRTDRHKLEVKLKAVFDDTISKTKGFNEKHIRIPTD